MSHRGESMEEDDIAMRVGNSLQTRDESMGEEGAVSPRQLIRRCPGLATTRSSLTLSLYISI